MNSKKIKILHVHVLPILSGVQKVSLDILKKLDDNLYDKYVLFGPNCDSADFEFCINSFKKSNTKILFCQSLRREISLLDFFAIKELYGIFKLYKFDIIHTHSTKPGILGRLVAKILKTNLIIHTIHGISFHKNIFILKRFIFYLMEILFSLLSHEITCVNNYYLKYYPFFRKKIHVIPNGLDFSILTHNTIYNRISNNFNVLFVGRLEDAKDPISLINAANIIKHKHKISNIKFTIIGDGSLYNICNKLIIDLDLSDTVALNGWSNNVNDFYACHDIFCVPSIFESFGLVFLEAGFYSLPTISTNVEGIPEVIINNKTGILINPNTPIILAEKIIMLYFNRNYAKQLGDNANKFVTKNFTIDKMFIKYENIYKKVSLN